MHQTNPLDIITMLCQKWETNDIHVHVFTTQLFFSTIANFAILITRLNPYMGCYESDCFDNETSYEKQLFYEDNFCSCLHQLKKSTTDCQNEYIISSWALALSLSTEYCRTLVIIWTQISNDAIFAGVILYRSSSNG